MHNMQNMCTLFAVWTSPFPYEPPPFRMRNMLKYDKKYAEYTPTPKKYAKKPKISKISKICHLKTGLTAAVRPVLRFLFSDIHM